MNKQQGWRSRVNKGARPTRGGDVCHPLRMVIVSIDESGSHGPPGGLHVHVMTAEWPQGDHACLVIPPQTLRELQETPGSRALLEFDEADPEQVRATVTLLRQKDGSGDDDT